jgi:uncharacterized protein with ATP-grasp and redox domains
LEDLLPPLYTTAGEESFARRSIRDRHAATLLEALELNAVGEPYRTRLLDFRAESLGGRLTDPFAAGGGSWDRGLFDPLELADWRRELAPHVGCSWYELPWYFAESFWFLKLLFAFGYYEPAGPNRLRDPFEPFKRRELSQPGGGLEAARELAPLLPARGGRPSGPAVRELLLASLWGNRMDLSMHGLAREYRGQSLRSRPPAGLRAGLRRRAAPHELLIDQSQQVADRLLATGRVDVILDNAGPELVCDLLLAAGLLAGGAPRRVVLHAKRSPFYVSDARPADVRATVRALAGDASPEVRAAGVLLERLEVREHWFWNGPRFFQDLPEPLHEELAASDLVLIKGDANYRRLVGDRHWPPGTPMEPLTAGFPAAFAVLRTMKSEIVVDLAAEQVQRLDCEDREWRTNGRRGLVRLVSRG